MITQGIICDQTSEKGPSGHKIHNGTYLELCVQYLLSVSCKMYPMKLLTDGKTVTYIALVEH